MFVSRRARRDARHRREDRQARDQVVRRRHRVPARVGTLTGWRKVYTVSGAVWLEGMGEGTRWARGGGTSIGTNKMRSVKHAKNEKGQERP